VIPSLLMQRPGEPRVEIIGGEVLSNRKRCDSHRGHHQFGKSRRRLQRREGIQLRHYVPQFIQSRAAFLARFDMGHPITGSLPSRSRSSSSGRKCKV
jgi:hypothetical protein